MQALQPKVENSELCRIECGFSRYLDEERGLSKATLDNYLPVIHRFLVERFDSDDIALDEIDIPISHSSFLAMHALWVAEGLS